MCSTPLGVTDLVTIRPTRKRLAPSWVLNASRRHRLGHEVNAEIKDLKKCSTPLGVTDLVTARPALRGRLARSVLNASRRHRLGHQLHAGPDPRPGPCAQRLSASQTWSRLFPRGRGSRPACSTPLGVTDLVTGHDHHGRDARVLVLNASRRHRLGHRHDEEPIQRHLRCSTPLGVTDLVTTRSKTPRRSSARAQRLSASQTWSRLFDAVELARSTECSTPLGVTDLVTLTADPVNTNVQSAQRLSASQTWSRTYGDTACRRLWVLNASRRHRLGHTSPTDGRRLPTECSTPLGVTDLVTGGNRRCSEAFSVLNASRRHRLGHRRRRPH